MKKSVYKITITDENFGELTGEFEAANEQQAIEFCKEFYSEELGTQEDDIIALKIEMVK